MLFGRIIVIKRDGQDGSVFPVTTEKTLIGRAKECNIRLQLPNVDDIHCAILIKENREPHIHNLSEGLPITLNGHTINSLEMMKLRSNDVFSIGGRTFRYIVITQVRRPSILKKVSFTTSKIELANSAAQREMNQKIVFSSPQLVSTSRSIPASNVIERVPTDIRSKGSIRNASSAVATISKIPSQPKRTPPPIRKPPSTVGKIGSQTSYYRPASTCKTAPKILTTKNSRRGDFNVKNTPALPKQRVKNPIKCVSSSNHKIDPMSNLRRKLKRSSVVCSFKDRTPPRSTTKIPKPKNPEELPKPSELVNAVDQESSCRKIDSTDSSSFLSLKLTPSGKNSRTTTPRSSTSKLKRANSTSLQDLKITPSSKVIVSENTPTLDFADHSISLPLSEGRSAKKTSKFPSRNSSTSLLSLKLTPSENGSKTSENSTPSLIVTPKFSAKKIEQEKASSLILSMETSSAKTASTEKRRSSKSIISKLDLNDENRSYDENADTGTTPSSIEKFTHQTETKNCVMLYEGSGEATMTPKLNDVVEKLCEDLCQTVTEQIKRSLAQNFPILERKSMESIEHNDSSATNSIKTPDSKKVLCLSLNGTHDENKSSANEKPAQTKVRFARFEHDENSKEIFSPETPNLGDFFRETSERKWKNIRKTPIRKTKIQVQPSTPNLSGFFDTPEAAQFSENENQFVFQLSCTITSEDREIFRKSFVAQSVKVDQPRIGDGIDLPSSSLLPNIEKRLNFDKSDTPKNENSVPLTKAFEITPQSAKPPTEIMSINEMAQGDNDMSQRSVLSSIRRSSRLAVREKTLTPRSAELKSTPARRTRRALATVTETPTDSVATAMEEFVPKTEHMPEAGGCVTEENSATIDKQTQVEDTLKIQEIPVKVTVSTNENSVTKKLDEKPKTRARTNKINIKSQAIEVQVESEKEITLESCETKPNTRKRTTRKNVKNQTAVQKEKNTEMEGIPVQLVSVTDSGLATESEVEPKTRRRVTKKNTETEAGKGFANEEIPDRLAVPAVEDLAIRYEEKPETKTRITRKNARSQKTTEHVDIEVEKNVHETIIEPPTVLENDKITNTRSTRKRAPAADAHFKDNETHQLPASKPETIEITEQQSVEAKKSRRGAKPSSKQIVPTQNFAEPVVEKRTLRSSTRNQKK